MRNVILLLLLFTNGLFGCQSKSAFDYSQLIVQMETELSSAIAIADERVGAFLDNNQTDSAILLSQHMEELADNKLKEIQKLEAPDVEEGENFKKAAVQYFVYLKAVYSSFKKFTMASNETEKENEREKLARMVGQKEQVTKELQEAQQKFAKANNFRIEKVKGVSSL